MQLEQRQQMKDAFCRPAQTAKECSMCGDVGFQQQLFRCTSCHKRHQHRYCSSFYPKALAEWVCDWCISRQPRRFQHPSPDQQASNHNSSSPANLLFKEEPCSTATRSPLDCLLEVAESTLNRENSSQQQQQQKQKVGLPPTGVKKPMRSNDSEMNTRMLQNNKSVLHKRKRCADLNINVSKQELHKFKSSSTPPSKPTADLQFSPSKATVGRRYRLLSEVLC